MHPSKYVLIYAWSGENIISLLFVTSVKMIMFAWFQFTFPDPMRVTKEYSKRTYHVTTVSSSSLDRRDDDLLFCKTGASKKECTNGSTDQALRCLLPLSLKQRCPVFECREAVRWFRREKMQWLHVQIQSLLAHASSAPIRIENSISAHWIRGGGGERWTNNKSLVSRCRNAQTRASSINIQRNFKRIFNKTIIERTIQSHFWKRIRLMPSGSGIGEIATGREWIEQWVVVGRLLLLLVAFFVVSLSLL